MNPRRLPLLALTALLIGGAAAPDHDEGAAQRIRAHVEFLASDLLEGRDTGSRGHEIGAAYVASQLRSFGLTPGGEGGGWFVQVPFRKATFAQTPKIDLIVGGKTKALTIGTDAAIRPSLTQRQLSITAPLVFVGRGISDARLGIDDYAGLDVRGKIVVALADRPPGIPNEIASHLRSDRPYSAARKGAVGYIEVSDPTSAAGELRRFATQPIIDWVDAEGRTGPSGLIGAAIALSEPIAQGLFKGAPNTLQAVRSASAAGKPVRGFALPAQISLSSRSDWKDFSSPAVIGLLPGSDPKLARERIVLMAHLDHLGLKSGAKAGEDAIHNGALDNAAGVATMIETARQFAESGKSPRRSVLFIANTGEEIGLRGADYLAAHPAIPGSEIVGLVGLDMPLLLYDFTDVVAFGFDHSTIAGAVEAAGQSMHVAVSLDPMPDEALFVRSDHYPFVKRGVPAIFLVTGWANGGQKVWQKFLAETYHGVKDDLTQPIRWDAGARFAELNYRIARALSDADRRPMWYSGDYFGETFAAPQPKARR